MERTSNNANTNKRVNERKRNMEQQEFVDELQGKVKTESLHRDLQTISDNLWEQIDHTILTHMMCLIVEHEDEIAEMIE